MKKIVKNVVWLLMLLAASATAQAQPAKGNTPCAESMATPLSEEGKLMKDGVFIDWSRCKGFHIPTDCMGKSCERGAVRNLKNVNCFTYYGKELKEEPLYTVKCVFKGEFMPYFAVYNTDFFVETSSEVWNTLEEKDTYYFSVPSGVYDVNAQFFCDDENTMGYAMLVKENVVVDKDVEILFDSDELTEKIVIKPRLKDGQPVILPTYIDGGTLDYTGSNAVFSALNYIFFKEGCYNLSKHTSFSDVKFPEDKIESEVVFRSNALSDKYHLVFQYLFVTDGEEFQISTTDMVGCKSGIVENYNMDYKRYEVPRYGKTPLYSENVQNGRISVSGRMWYNDLELTSTGYYTEKEQPVVYWTQQPMDESINIKAPISVVNVQKEECYSFEFDGEIYTDLRRADISCLPSLYSYSDSGWEYINQNHSECGNYAYQIPLVGNSVPEYPGVPAYCFFANEVTQSVGNSAPVLSLMNQVIGYNDWNIFYFDPNAYVGRYGEVRNCDLWTQQVEVMLDGKKVFDNADGGYLEDWCIENSTDGHEKGVIEATFIDTNVLVDETIPGFNHTTITVDERNEDLCTPTPQMLIFKNTAGAVTDRFDKAEDGVIEFSAGDFNWFGNGDRHGYTCEEADVLVEYAPYGEDSFEPIEVEEIPENYYMPGFGYFYRGSLRDVAQKSSNGWFDVRFTLTDKAGNRMVQRVSPAFRIDANVGVAAVEANGLRIKSEEGRVTVSGEGIKAIELYSADGRLVGVASGNELDASGYRGLGIVKVTDTKGATTTAKVIVR